MEANLTDFKLDWQDPYNDLGLWMKIVLGIYILFTWFVGTLLSAVIVLFEHYGGDPQKRGLLNQVPNKLIRSSKNTLCCFLALFQHGDWQHCLLQLDLAHRGLEDLDWSCAKQSLLVWHLYHEHLLLPWS